MGKWDSTTSCVWHGAWRAHGVPGRATGKAGASLDLLTSLVYEAFFFTSGSQLSMPVELRLRKVLIHLHDW